jgi:hypothetical protein
LNQDGSSARLLVGFEQMGIGLKPSRQALRVIEPVDADHQGPVSDTLAQAAHVSGAIRAGRLRGDRANIDTNREHLRSHDTAKGLPNTAPELLRSGPAHQIIAKAIEVLLRLEADQIVSAQRSDEREESAAEGLMFRGLSAGGRWIRTCMGLLLSSGCCPPGQAGVALSRGF